MLSEKNFDRMRRDIAMGAIDGKIPVIIIDEKTKVFIKQDWINQEVWKKICKKDTSGKRFLWHDDAGYRTMPTMASGEQVEVKKIARLFSRDTVVIQVETNKLSAADFPKYSWFYL
jgi:hypothetical protein